jgi:hypothetical protein
MEKEEIKLAITEAILPYKKYSERIVGYTQFTLNFQIQHYHGISHRPEKVSILEKTIVNLIGKGVSDIDKIALYLGLDRDDTVEDNMLRKALENLSFRLELINAYNNFNLTEKGSKFNETGQSLNTISNNFDIYVAPNHLYFPFLKECIEGLHVTKISTDCEGITLPLKEIKFFAETQASYVQFEENQLNLISADLLKVTNAKIDFHVCFLQSIRDNSIRTIVYSTETNAIIDDLAILFDSDINLRDNLLKKCLLNEVLEDKITLSESSEKSLEQIQTEAKLIAKEDAEQNSDKTNKENFADKVGKVYDSVEFEKELNDIFEKHNNDEIWLISPWIKDYAFLRVREPKIRTFLDNGGAIFIGFSEPEKHGEEMVDKESMNIVNNLDQTYDKFYVAELHKFHMKNVIELKSKIATLYTGSFNILSFCINGNEEYYRMEHMTLANRNEANKLRAEYLDTFATQYVNRYINLISSSSGDKIDVSKLKYLQDIGAINNLNEVFSDVLKTTQMTICYSNKNDKEYLLGIAEKIIADKYTANPIKIQARLAAIQFVLENANNSDKQSVERLEKTLLNTLAQDTLYNVCQCVMRKGKSDSKKSIISLICNKLNFEFGEILLPPYIFKKILPHKINIDLKDKGIRKAHYRIKEILYNSAKACGYSKN